MRLRRGGFEPPTFGSVDRCSRYVTANSDPTYENPDSVLASCLARLAQDEPDLAAIVAAWPELLEAIRAGIVAMVKATGE